MMEQVSLSNQVSKLGILKPSYKCIPSVMLVCSKTSQTLTNQSETETVRSTLCNHLLKDTTQSYYRLPKSYESVNHNYESSVGNCEYMKRQIHKSETEKSRNRALDRESGFGCNYSTSCIRPIGAF